MLLPQLGNVPNWTLFSLKGEAAEQGQDMIIQTAEEYQAAIARISALGENAADGPDQNEFFALSAAMVDYETRSHRAINTEAGMIKEKKAIVRCSDDYDRAKERIAEIGNMPTTPEEEAELFGLIDAVEKWDARHEDDE